MPHLRIRNVDEQHLLSVSQRLTDRLQKALDCDRSWITLDHEVSRQALDGQWTAGNPFVEILWFARPKEVAKALATILSEELKREAEFVTVIFRELDKALYFEDGMPYA